MTTNAEIADWLKREANRNLQIASDIELPNRRVKKIKRRARMLRRAASIIETHLERVP